MIAVDVGNTSIQFGLFKGGALKKLFQIDSQAASLTKLKKVLAKYPKEKIIICSVVPKITRLFKQLPHRVCIVGPEKIPIKCLYDLAQIGSDRLIVAFAAKKLFKETRMILDFGTAITLDFLNQQGDYQGGLILPGIGSTLKVFSKCALLPNKLDLRVPKGIIPRSTPDSINKGLKQGFSLMVNSLISQYQRKLGIFSRIPVVITGGEAGFIKSLLNFKYRYQPHLALKGLAFLAAEKK